LPTVVFLWVFTLFRLEIPYGRKTYFSLLTGLVKGSNEFFLVFAIWSDVAADKALI